MPKSWQWHHLATPPLPLSFTVVSDHPKAGELLRYCGLQTNMVPVNIPIIFWFRAKYSAVCLRSSVWSALLLILSGQIDAPQSGTIQHTV